MNSQTRPAAAADGSAVSVLSAHAKCSDTDALEKIYTTFSETQLALVILFVTPSVDFSETVERASSYFGDTPVLACTTAGEISESGYTEEEIVAVAFPSAIFRVDSMVIEDLDQADTQSLIDQTIRTRRSLARSAPNWPNEFAFMMIDGLSLKEDELAFALATGLGPVPLFGGSAGDGTRFEETFVSINGRTMQNAAIVTFFRTLCPVEVFSFDHLKPTTKRMVVTDADPSRRMVRQINAEPAAREYARLLGKDPEQLSPFTFAAHPVVVTIGGTHHVRAIQQVTEDGELIFFSAIDEGLVLTLAEPENMSNHLEGSFSGLARPDPPQTILACDCILRRLEAGQTQQTSQISKILAENHVVGFSTYGEQINAMHVNHTMTGVAIYPPGPETGADGRDDEVAGRSKR